MKVESIIDTLAYMALKYLFKEKLMANIKVIDWLISMAPKSSYQSLVFMMLNITRDMQFD